MRDRIFDYGRSHCRSHPPRLMSSIIWSELIAISQLQQTWDRWVGAAVIARSVEAPMLTDACRKWQLVRAWRDAHCLQAVWWRQHLPAWAAAIHMRQVHHSSKEGYSCTKATGTCTLGKCQQHVSLQRLRVRVCSGNEQPQTSPVHLRQRSLLVLSSQQCLKTTTESSESR